MRLRVCLFWAPANAIAGALALGVASGGAAASIWQRAVTHGVAAKARND